MQNCYDAKIGIFIKNIFLGGAQNLYGDANFKELLGNLADEEEEKIIIFPTQDGDTIIRTSVYASEAIPYYSILPAKKGTKKGEKNTASLVVLINDLLLPMIIMGDGTGETTKHLSTNDKELPLGCLLHAAHHGANTHECNSSTWLTHIKPRGIVFSSGVNTGLRHPRGEIVMRIADLLPEEGDYYPLYVGIDETALRYYAKGSQKYGLTAVRKFIRGTLTQGTITYSSNPVTAQIVDVTEHSTNSPSIKVCVLEALLKFPLGLLAEDHLQEIDISDLDIQDEEPELQHPDRAILHKLIDSLTAKGAHLKTLHMQKNHINAPITINKLIKLLLSRKNILTINLSENNIAPLLKTLFTSQLEKQPTTKVLV